MIQNRPHLIPCIVAALMLLGALGDWPYGYFQLLRFVVCGVSAYMAYMAYNWRVLWSFWVFVIISALFNPVIPIELSREIWQPIDIICAVFFLVIIFILKKPIEQKNG